MRFERSLAPTPMGGFRKDGGSPQSEKKHQKFLDFLASGFRKSHKHQVFKIYRPFRFAKILFLANWEILKKSEV